MIKQFKSVALTREVVKLLKSLADEDMRSIPRTIEYLAKLELKRRSNTIKEKSNLS